MKTVRVDHRRESSVGSRSNQTATPEVPTALSSEEIPASVKVVPTAYPTSPPLEDCLDRFWDSGAELDDVTIEIRPPERALSVLEELGPSPFPRGGFPLVGFLATTYDKVSRFALGRK